MESSWPPDRVRGPGTAPKNKRSMLTKYSKLTLKLSGINADSQQSLEVWNRTRKIIEEMNIELGQGEPPKYQPSIKKIIIQPDPNEPNESTSLD